MATFYVCLDEKKRVKGKQALGVAFAIADVIPSFRDSLAHKVAGGVHGAREMYGPIHNQDVAMYAAIHFRSKTGFNTFDELFKRATPLKRSEAYAKYRARYGSIKEYHP